jgi:hypothetical protein
VIALALASAGAAVPDFFAPGAHASTRSVVRFLLKENTVIALAYPYRAPGQAPSGDYMICDGTAVFPVALFRERLRRGESVKGYFLIDYEVLRAPAQGAPFFVGHVRKARLFTPGA